MSVEKWILDVDKITTSVQKLTAQLIEEELNWKPEAEVWNVGQILEHVQLMTNSFQPIFTAVHEGTYEMPVMGNFGSVAVNFLGKTLLKAMSPNRAKKVKTFPIWEPTKKKYAKTILKDFAESQAALKQMIIDAEPLLGQDIIIASPVHKHLAYTLDLGIEIIITHEQRHVEQIKEVLKTLVE